VEKHNDGTCTVHLNPLVSPHEEGLTAVHQLAALDVNDTVDHHQISSRIIQLVLETFSNPESLGPFRIHPRKGVPLLVAVSNANFVMVDALLESPGWRTDVVKEIEIEKPDGSRVKMSAAEVAVDKILHRIDSIREDTQISAEDMDGLIRLWSMVQKILMYRKHYADGKSRDFTTITPQISQRIAQLRLDHLAVQLQQTSLDEGEPDHSIEDLSVITEEKPTNWVEGSEMNGEQAMRTFLKWFRTRKGSIDEVMDTAYNKRTRG
jgi:hypothetical protein